MGVPPQIGMGVPLKFGEGGLPQGQKEIRMEFFIVDNLTSSSGLRGSLREFVVTAVILTPGACGREGLSGSS